MYIIFRNVAPNIFLSKEEILTSFTGKIIFFQKLSTKLVTHFVNIYASRCTHRVGCFTCKYASRVGWDAERSEGGEEKRKEVSSRASSKNSNAGDLYRVENRVMNGGRCVRTAKTRVIDRRGGGGGSKSALDQSPPIQMERAIFSLKVCDLPSFPSFLILNLRFR